MKASINHQAVLENNLFFASYHHCLKLYDKQLKEKYGKLLRESPRMERKERNQDITEILLDSELIERESLDSGGDIGLRSTLHD